MLALLSSRYRNSSIGLNFQRTPFCFPSNYPRLVLLALPPTTSHVISIHSILARLSSDCLLEGQRVVVIFKHVIVGELRATYMVPSHYSFGVSLCLSEFS